VLVGHSNELAKTGTYLAAASSKILSAGGSVLLLLLLGGEIYIYARNKFAFAAAALSLSLLLILMAINLWQGAVFDDNADVLPFLFKPGPWCLRCCGLAQSIAISVCSGFLRLC
jgi:hypothetical protein